MSKEAISKTPERRVRRTPLGQRNVLSVSGKEPGYEYRFVNDTSDRVAQFQEAGWELVPQAGVRIGDKRVGTPTAEGSQAQASVGGGDKAYLMRIRSDWFQEDQARKQEYVNATEAATKQEALDGTYGKLDLNSRE
jgi:hypothetical protein